MTDTPWAARVAAGPVYWLLVPFRPCWCGRLKSQACIVHRLSHMLNMGSRDAGAARRQLCLQVKARRAAETLVRALWLCLRATCLF